MKLWVSESDESVNQLSKRLLDFYNDPGQRYNAFEGESKLDGYWEEVARRIEELASDERRGGDPVRVLEIGAGRTGFPRFMQGRRGQMLFVAQDVTTRNADHLQQVADGVHLGDLESCRGEFDVIFSTFVWEHIPRPVEALEEMLRLLAPGGSLFLFSPRYDALGYVPPALRHLSWAESIAASSRLHAARWRSFFRGTCDFFIVSDPAVFNCTAWFRDADAVHLVSRRDLRNYAKRRGLVVRDCWPRHEKMRYTVLEYLTKLCVEVRHRQRGPLAAAKHDRSKACG
jgi:SAM-dependent methyltransferase